ncbi:putative mrna degradation protein [Erysiphe neolycopersici]|uniref:Putative mrna degradation protein n=1 Tax=Erysiphe neolycopersici TaxID=212602 RepID=A0A420HY44_9PEZI|nr:putative mrna degradation protein [Erysiphe neolycopersici]
MAQKYVPAAISSYKTQILNRCTVAIFNKRLNLSLSIPKTCKKTQFRSLTTAELKPVGDRGAEINFKSAEIQGESDGKELLLESSVNEKTVKLTLETEINEGSQHIISRENNSDIDSPELQVQIKTKKRSGKKKKVKSQSDATTKNKTKLKRAALAKVKTSLSKSTVISEIKKLSKKAELPVDWKNSLLNILNNSQPLNSSEEVVVDAIKSALTTLSKPSTGKSKVSCLQWKSDDFETITAMDLSLNPISNGEINVPRLSYGLDRVLFNQGVYQLQDPRTRVFNFDPYLREIMPVGQFDYGALSKYITSSRDNLLLSKAIEENKKYVGSTSSMSSTLNHFHFLLSNWRPIEYGNLSGKIPPKLKICNYTMFTRAPTAIFLRYRDGNYAVDADKEFDDSNILAMLGKSMEKLLTLPTERFERYRRDNSDQLSEEERNEKESYHYTTFGDFLLRSQLDAYDPRLPGTGMFDLKTRCVISVRMDVSEYENSKSYEIRKVRGEWESFEREYYDMIRSAFLKYSMQVRMGRMDGIFVAFHNTSRIFGFQYISLAEMDYALHGTEDPKVGDEEFKLSLSLLNKIFDRATEMFPKKTLRFFFDTQPPKKGELVNMKIIAQPLEEEEVDAIQAQAKERIESFERNILGIGDHDSEVEENEIEHSSYIPNWDGTEFKSNKLGWDKYLMEKEIAEDIIEGEVVDEDAITEDALKLDASKIKLSEMDSINNVSRENNTKSTVLTGTMEERIENQQECEDNVHHIKDSQDEETETISDDFESFVENDATYEKFTGLQEDSDDFSNRPFLALKLTVRSKVNDVYVERPNNLTGDDTWAVEYCLSQYPDRTSSINVYRELKKRRRAVHTGKLDMNPDKPPTSSLVRQLRKYIEKGRTFRERENKIESKLQIQIVGQDISSSVVGLK